MDMSQNVVDDCGRCWMAYVGVCGLCHVLSLQITLYLVCVFSCHRTPNSCSVLSRSAVMCVMLVTMGLLWLLVEM